jgi:hypothetical protein
MQTGGKSRGKEYKFLPYYLGEGLWVCKKDTEG